MQWKSTQTKKYKKEIKRLKQLLEQEVKKKVNKDEVR